MSKTRVNPGELFKLAESAAPAENRIMPSERVYNKSSKTVSVEEAVALLKKRKADPSARIKGGLDDESDEMRKGYKPAPKPSAAKSEKDLMEELFPEFKAMIQEELKAAQPAQPAQPAEPAANAAKAAPAKASKAKVSTAVLSEKLDGLHAQLCKFGVAITSLLGKREDPVPENPRPDRLEEFKSGSHRVTFVLNGMEFTVKCLNMVKDEAAHSLVLAFSSDADSFFAPPMQSELTLRYDGTPEPGRLYYFGMQFSLETLGLRFLGFLYDDSPRDDNQ